MAVYFSFKTSQRKKTTITSLVATKSNYSLKIYRTKWQETAFRRQNREEEKTAVNNKRTSQ
jgi:hypothetical protein